MASNATGQGEVFVFIFDGNGANLGIAGCRLEAAPAIPRMLPHVSTPPCRTHSATPTEGGETLNYELYDGGEMTSVPLCAGIVCFLHHGLHSICRRHDILAYSHEEDPLWCG